MNDYIQQPQQFKVVETRTAPNSNNLHTLSEETLTREELSARYPRARTYGGLVLLRYEDRVGLDDFEYYETKIAASNNEVELSEDPRIIDENMDPTQLPQGYQVGEGYAAWKERTSRLGGEPYILALPKSEQDTHELA